MSENYITTVPLLEEQCCEMCKDVIHTHFDCPECETDLAGTSAYGRIEEGIDIECEECGATFWVEDYRHHEADIEFREE